MNITPNSSIDTNGFSLAYELSCTLDAVVQMFPSGLMTGYVDPDKGYNGIEVGFITGDGEGFYVYARWDVCRLGCLAGWNNPLATAFKNWIEAAVNGV